MYIDYLARVCKCSGRMQRILAFGRRGIFAELRASSKLLKLHNYVLLVDPPISVHRALCFGQSTLHFRISYGPRTSILKRTLSLTPFQLSRFQDEDPDQESYSIREEGHMSREGQERRGRDPRKVKQEEEGGGEFSDIEKRSRGGRQRRGGDPQKVEREEAGGRETEKRLTGAWRRRGRDPWKLKRERFNRHMLNLVRKGRMEEAEEVFQHMRNGNIYPDTVSFNVLISGYAKMGDIKKAFKLFNDLKKCALLPTNPTYTSLFKACARAGLESQEYLKKIQAEIERRNVILNQIAMNALISALAACERHEEAFQVYLDMPKLRLEPSMHTFSSLLQAASKDRVGGLETAQRVWTEMLACGFQPDVYSYNLLLMCLRDAGIPESMEQSVSGSGEEEVPRDSHEMETGTTDSKEMTRRPASSPVAEAISLVSWTLFPTIKQTPSERKGQFLNQRESKKLTLSLGKGNLRWLEEGEVEQLLESMQMVGLKPDIRTFQLLASLLVSAPFLLQQMEVHGVALDKKCVVTMIRAQALLGNLEEARGLLEVAEKMGVQLEQAGFQAVARGCIEQSQGMELLEEMKGLGMQPNVYVFGTLIGNAARMKKYHYLSALLKEMKLMEVLPNQTISDILENVAHTVPTSPEAKKRHNGFSGYYHIWKRTMCPE